MITNTHTHTSASCWLGQQPHSCSEGSVTWRKLSRSSTEAKANGPKEGLGTPGGRDRAAHELGRARKPGTGDRKLEKDAEGGGRRRGGKGGVYGCGESKRGECVRVP